jgi:PKD repeat protein
MKKLFSLVALTFALNGLAQEQTDWVEAMFDPNVSLPEAQARFDAFWNGKEVEKGKGYKQFKRWEAFWNPRVDAAGMRPDPAIYAQALQEKWMSTAKTSSTANWTQMGPVNGDAIDGIGRLNGIAFHPTNANTIFVGAPAGGLWKSTDNGVTWTTTTDQLTNLGVTSIVIDPLHPDTMYIATGDRDAADTYSFGVMKSTDGGATWNPTGLAWNVTQQRRIGRLWIHPTNPQILLAATRSGMHRTTDGGTTWTMVQSGAFNTLVQKAGNPNVILAATYNSASVWRSTNAGLTWTNVTTASGSGLPTSNNRRVEMAVSIDDTNKVYAVFSNNSNGFLAVYRSNDGGVTWTQRANSPNLLGWATDGSDSGGQGWYDLAISVSPTNADVIHVGGVNIWKSTDGGANWNLNAHWYGGGGAAYVHADIHDLQYKPGTDQLFACSDGGLDYTSNGGTTWTQRNNGLKITQYYKMASAQTGTDYVLGGAQDNGTHRGNGVTWTRVRGGDGMDCAIDPNNSSVMYASIYYGDFRKSTNGGGSFGATFNNPTNPANGNWVTPFVIDPNSSSTLYMGYDRLWQSTDGGVSWTSISNNGSGVNTWGSNKLNVIEVAPSNSSIIYVAYSSTVWRTTNGGTSWTNIASNIPGSDFVTGVEVAAANPNRVYVSVSGYNSGSKVFLSTDGGNSFTNISGTLPNVPANCLAYQPASPHGVYVGTDIGVYYTDTTMTDWIAYDNGLPNVIVNDLEIKTATGTLRAGTYGRGIWETPLYTQAVTPVADFSANNLAPCAGIDAVTFTNQSLNTPTSFNWTFPGGSPATSNVANPVVTYATVGTYGATLQASNGTGSNTLVKNAYINVQPTPAAPVIAFNGTQLSTTATGVSYTWSVNGIVVSANPSFTPVDQGIYTLEVTNPQGCSNSATIDLSTLSLNQPTAPVVQVYPNPAGAWVNIRVSGTLETTRIAVLDLSGRTLMEEWGQPNTDTRLNLEGMAAGVYLIQLSNGYWQEVHKMEHR